MPRHHCADLHVQGLKQLQVLPCTVLSVNTRTNALVLATSERSFAVVEALVEAAQLRLSPDERRGRLRQMVGRGRFGVAKALRQPRSLRGGRHTQFGVEQGDEGVVGLQGGVQVAAPGQQAQVQLLRALAQRV